MGLREWAKKQNEERQKQIAIATKAKVDAQTAAETAAQAATKAENVATEAKTAAQFVAEADVAVRASVDAQDIAQAVAKAVAAAAEARAASRVAAEAAARATTEAETAARTATAAAAAKRAAAEAETAARAAEKAKTAASEAESATQVAVEAEAAIRAVAEAELKAVKPHLFHDLEENGRLLYFRMLMVLLYECKPVFSDEKQAAWALRKWSYSMGFDAKIQQNITLEVSNYDNALQQDIAEKFAKAADKGMVCCLFCDFIKLYGKKYDLSGDILAFIRDLAQGVFCFSLEDTQTLELLCKKIASEELLRYDNSLVSPIKEVVDFYARVINATSTYLVIDLSGGANTSAYSIRIEEAAPELSDDTCRTSELWLKRIPKGRFRMNAVKNAHDVTLTQDYYIGVFPVTQRQWELVMGDNPSHFKDCDSGTPVENISYDDICGESRSWPQNDSVIDNSFLGRLRSKTGLQNIDLPSEAQWEYACRAGNIGGPQDGTLGEVAWYRNNSNDKTHKVGQKAPNVWGLYDMHGNVREWCKDWYGEYPGGHVTDPAGLASGLRRVNRGGSWFSFAGGCGSAFRSSDATSKRCDDLGFRQALVPVQ